tara:strand:+ start:190 stop:1341 length:1152 start_codon:yes stop_codon:yes gene_type:complete
MYDLSQFLDPLNNDEKIIKNVIEIDTENKNKYKIINYDGLKLNKYDFLFYGLCRSIITMNDSIVSFSPPKTLDYTYFKSSIAIKDTIIEELIDGTMINLFYNRCLNKWEIATRKTVGGNNGFYRASSKTFKELYNEIRKEINLNYDFLSKHFCYTFIMQHRENRIVTPVINNNLYLVAVYEISGTSVYNVDIASDVITSLFKQTQIKFPQRISTEGITYDKIYNVYSEPGRITLDKGYIIKNIETGRHTTVINPIYTEIKNLRGNQPKLQYQYLSLRKHGKVNEYLRYYPEEFLEITKYRDQLHQFTSNLFNNYIKCFIYKECALKNYPFQYKVNMYTLHEIYKNDLRPFKKCITKNRVIEYVNSLNPEQQMFFINYNVNKYY